MDLNTRKLRYFVAVAEELHFGRAATKLFIAQQALSKQIHELEEQLGVRLLDRTSRRVALTSAGEAFLSAAHAALATIEAGIDAAQRAASATTGTLKLGYIVGGALELTEPILREMATRYPEIELELREFDLRDVSAGLNDGSSDIAFVRPPIAGPFELDPLLTEPRVVVLPSSHPLAERLGVEVDELLDLPMATGTTDDATWVGFWCLEHHRNGRPAPIVARTGIYTELLMLVATNRACIISGASAARLIPFHGVRMVPITDIPGSVVAVARPRGEPTPLLARFLEVVRDVRDRETALVDAIEHPDFAASTTR